MKPKGKVVPSSTKDRSQTHSEDDRRRVSRRQIWMRIAAIFLVIVFLASECAILLPME